MKLLEYCSVKKFVIIKYVESNIMKTAYSRSNIDYCENFGTTNVIWCRSMLRILKTNGISSRIYCSISFPRTLQSTVKLAIQQNKLYFSVYSFEQISNLKIISMTFVLKSLLRFELWKMYRVLNYTVVKHSWRLI